MVYSLKLMSSKRLKKVGNFEIKDYIQKETKTLTKEMDFD